MLLCQVVSMTQGIILRLFPHLMAPRSYMGSSIICENRNVFWTNWIGTKDALRLRLGELNIVENTLMCASIRAIV